VPSEVRDSILLQLREHALQRRDIRDADVNMVWTLDIRAIVEGQPIDGVPGLNLLVLGREVLADKHVEV